MKRSDLRRRFSSPILPTSLGCQTPGRTQVGRLAGRFDDSPPTAMSHLLYHLRFVADVMLMASLQLGLGDFIFYSLLVGRAAMYDLMTVYACYLAIIAGLGEP